MALKFGGNDPRLPETPLAGCEKCSPYHDVSWPQTDLLSISRVPAGRITWRPNGLPPPWMTATGRKNWAGICLR